MLDGTEMLQLPEELQMLRGVVRRFIENEVVPLEAAMDFDQYAPSSAESATLQTKARELGLWCMAAPKEYGGQGLGALGLAVVAEEASKHRNGAYNPALGAFGREPPGPLYGGTKKQIETYVIPVIEGKKKSFFALTEPSGGSDPARAVRTTAVKKGSKWILNGRKIFISGAGDADFGLVVARTGEGRTGLTSFIVERDTPGLSMSPIPVIRPMYPYELLLEDVEVPEENVIRAQGSGFAVAQERLVRTRVPYAAGCIGIGQKALEMAVDYARDRVTFGEPLANRQAVQWMLVDSEIELRSARWLTWEAAIKCDRHEPARTEVSIAKIVATETAGRVVDRAIQVFGGMGVTRDLPFERWYRELRIKRIGEGPSEVHRHVIARDLFHPDRRLA